MQSIPPQILDALQPADSSWRPILLRGLQAMMQQDPQYLSELIQRPFLPTDGRLFAAFSIPLEKVRYVLVGEGPYPRAESATGVCFMDGAVEALWSANGLSKQVNRATSLRNFIKMLLVADGRLPPDKTTGEAVAAACCNAEGGLPCFVQTLPQLQANLVRQGFLLLNASLIFRPDVPPAREARAWRPMIETVLSAMSSLGKENGHPLPTLVLWGKIAEQLACLACVEAFPRAVSEHPYNLSFIHNPSMQALFKPMRLLVPPGEPLTCAYK